MKRNIVFRKAEPEDIPGLIGLFKVCFNKESSEREWRWKYHENPWGAVPYIALLDNEIVAHYGCIKYKFLFQGKTFWGYQKCDVMSHPQKGRFLSTRPPIVRLGEMFYAKNEMDFTFGFPSERHARLQVRGLKSDGYTFVNAFSKRISEESKKGPTFKVLKPAENTLKAIQGISSNPSHNLYIEKDLNYLKWRYSERPFQKYVIIAVKGLFSIKEAAIVKRDGDGLLVLDIFSKRDIRERLIPAVESYALKEGLSFVKLWANPDDESLLQINKAGYTSCQDIPLSFREVNKEKGLTMEVFFKNYLYKMGDYDAV